MQRVSKAVLCAVVAFAPLAMAEDYYVSIGRGKGKEASKEKPAKDLGNIIAQLKDGDTVHIAEGVYVGRDETGSDTVPVAVKIIGGYADDFSSRDPWGAHKTILTGIGSLKGSTRYRLILEPTKCAELLVDGLIFDNGPRNHYADEKELAIRRTANANADKNASPESGGLSVVIPKKCSATVQNVIVMNTAPTVGALAVWGNQATTATIQNNLVINNTGEGIYTATKWASNNDQPAFTVDHNTVLFSWKHDPIATYGGNGLKTDSGVKLTISNNVFGFGDYGGFDNIKLTKGITFKSNLLTGNRFYDYREFNTQVAVGELEDEADQLTKDSTGNVSKEIKVPLGKKWAEIYASRKEISRAEVDAKAKAANNGANALRSMLGLPLQANAVNIDAEIWLPRMSIDDAVSAGSARYAEAFGCQKP